MIEHQELWQVFAENGEAIEGRGASDTEFSEDTSLVNGNSHVWCWRDHDGIRQILLQKRAMTKRHKPGYYHASACGHINVGETAIDAALRETREELGLQLDASRLYFLQTVRGVTDRHFKTVYIYQLSGDETFTFDDGEVDSVEWVSVAKFREMTEDAEKYKIVDQGGVYFDAVIGAIETQ